MRTAALLLLATLSARASEAPAPAAYVAALAEGTARVRAALDAQPAATLRSLEQQPGFRHFPHAILAPAVLYTLRHPANPHRGKAELLALALRIGDLLAAEDERGAYMDRLDSYWDTTLWLDAYRLLQPHLGPERAGRWRRALERNIALVELRVAAWRDFPRYTAPYLGTSTNHFAQWAANVYLAGRLFSKPAWARLGGEVLHRFATEQNPGGFWGELSPDVPTSGYNLLTLSAVGLYHEHSQDPAALEAVRRATSFHMAFTWPNGEPVELFNDRNRYWEAWLYGNFAFSHTAAGRGFAAHLFDRYPTRPLDTEQLGRTAQNLLYFHDGPTTPWPQQRTGSSRLAGPAGIRHAGPWSIALSGLSGRAPDSTQWFLDRQSSVAVFHRAKGLILSGGNSRRQPELASFLERLASNEIAAPLDAKLDMGSQGDHLSLAFNRFFADLEVPAPTSREARLRFAITGRGPAPDLARLTLQVVLVPGQEIRTGAGQRAVVAEEPISWDAGQLGGSLHHNGWTLRLPPGARLQWPVRPYNPYRNGPETRLGRAVAALSVDLVLRPDPARFVRPAEAVLDFAISIDGDQ